MLQARKLRLQGPNARRMQWGCCNTPRDSNCKVVGEVCIRVSCLGCQLVHQIQVERLSCRGSCDDWPPKASHSCCRRVSEKRMMLVAALGRMVAQVSRSACPCAQAKKQVFVGVEPDRVRPYLHEMFTRSTVVHRGPK